MADNNRGLASSDQATRERVAQEGGETHKNQGADYSKLGQKGGQAAHEAGTAHEWNSEEASEAGKIGGSK